MLFPIRDNVPTYRTPYVTISLIVINCLVFLYSQTLGYQGFQTFIMKMGFTPGFYFSSAEYTLPGYYVWTPLFSMFLHGGWMHLIGNMLFLWIYGNNIEDYFGPVKFVIFYLLAGLAAVALYSVFNLGSHTPLVGASGAIAGVMGGYMVLHPRAEITCLLFFFFITLITLSAKSVLGIWFVYQVLMSVWDSSTGGGVAWLAHVGGFGFGYLVLRLFVKLKGGPRVRPQTYRIRW